MALAVLAGLLSILSGGGPVGRGGDGVELPSLRLAELTWTEIHAALEQGFDTVIVPTGGTEQNGPHLVLGKHNDIVDYTSVRIADELGRTLVAPVLAYVPEGDIEPRPQGHMEYPGTISLPENVFEAVLEAAARSLKAHGFKRIFFIGDSGGNQDAQARIAAKLQNVWRDDDILVAQIGDYYAANGQMEELLAQGFSAEEIGTHAGIRDTSELAFVRSSGVRADPLAAPAGMRSGANGDAGRASAVIGRRMVELKIAAALAQIGGLGKP
ncbi:MAG: creatininase family protein [Alphaproteobacteria bacterium]|nr:creatininase family protein [Alphaproteobacteria bacterium]